MHSQIRGPNYLHGALLELILPLDDFVEHETHLQVHHSTLQNLGVNFLLEIILGPRLGFLRLRPVAPLIPFDCLVLPPHHSKDLSRFFATFFNTCDCVGPGAEGFAELK